MLFTRPNTSLLEGLLKDDILFSKISEVLFDPAPDIRLVSRAATLLRQLISHFPEQTVDCCGFLVKIVEFAYEPCVFDLIEKVCDPKAGLTAMLTGLLEAHWGDTLLLALEAAGSEEVVAALIRTIRIAAENPVLAPGFRTRKMLAALVGFLENPSKEVQIELWPAACSVVSETEMEETEIFMRHAIGKFTARIGTVDRAHVFALDFLVVVVEKKVASVAALISREVQEVMLALTAEFPDSSNLMGSVFRFIRACLFWDVTMPAAVERFVPAMAAEASDSIRSAALAHCFELLDELTRCTQRMPELDRELKKVDIFAEFCRTYLPKFRRVSRSEYGGMIQTVPVNRFSALSVF
jgi:hypothetical protein